jgi:hypothetical protein
MKRLAALAGSILLIGGLAVVPVASAAPISKTTMFRAFNGKVMCGVEIHNPKQKPKWILCAAGGIPAPKHGGIGDSGFVQLSLLGGPQTLKLSQNSFIQGSSSKLGRGRLWNQLGVTCHVAASTVLCLNGANHGFIIGNGRYKTF